jgi:hypothetical protein
MSSSQTGTVPAMLAALHSLRRQQRPIGQHSVDTENGAERWEATQEIIRIHDQTRPPVRRHRRSMLTFVGILTLGFLR